MVLPAGGSVPGWSCGSPRRSSPLQLVLWTTHCCSCLAGIPGRSVASAGVLGSKVPRNYHWDRQRESTMLPGLLKLNYFAALRITQKTCAAVAGNRPPKPQVLTITLGRLRKALMKALPAPHQKEVWVWAFAFLLHSNHLLLPPTVSLMEASCQRNLRKAVFRPPALCDRR